MKKMNKVAATVLAAAMVVPMAVPAFATTAPAGTAAKLNQTADTKLNYTIAQGYEWTIPDEITFATDTDTKTGTVGVTNCFINKDATLKITIAPKTGETFQLTSGQGATYDYKVTKGGVELTKGGEVLSIIGGSKTADSQELSFALQAQAVKTAGVYSGFVTFSADVQ